MGIRRIIRLVATGSPYSYGGQLLSNGDKFMAPKGDAHTLVSNLQAKLDDEAEVVEEIVHTTPKSKSRNSYLRRDRPMKD